MRAANKKFPWGKVLDTISVNLDDGTTPVEVIKYETYKANPEEGTEIKYFVPTGPGSHSGTSTHSMSAALVEILARKHLGYNQHALVAGMCRMLGIEG